MTCVFCGFTHERSDRVVAAQVPPDFLVDHVGRFRSEDHPWSALMGFQFVERGFDFPPLRVRSSEFGGCDVVGVQDRGEQPELTGFVAGAVVDGVVDQTNPEGFAAFEAGGVRRSDLHKPGPVGEFLNRVGFDRLRDPPQQISAGRCGLFPQGEAVETAV